jgi:hypothetical protein
MTEKAKKFIPEGGRKGGTRFPQLDLRSAEDYAKRLVAKTHTGPLPASTILPGVFDSATSNGKIRASALKQYGFLEGTSDAYTATDLARQIAAATPEDIEGIRQKACLTPQVFRDLFEIIKGDKVSRPNPGLG